MSNIISESKKISDLPAILGFSENAVVLIVDGGKTAQMNLKLLTRVIAEACVGKDSSIMTSIRINADNIRKSADNIKTIKENQNDFQTETAGKFSGLQGNITRNESLLVGALYESVEITVPENSITNHQYVTEDLNVGDTFDPLERQAAAETGVFAFSRTIGRGDIIYIGDLYDMPSADRSPKIILVDGNGIVNGIVLMSEARMNKKFSFGDKEGTMYLSSFMPAEAGTITFVHKSPIDYVKLKEDMGLSEYVFDWNMMETTGKIYDTAAADSYNVYTPKLLAGDSPTTYAHKQKVEPGWILCFSGCQKVVRKDASTHLVIVNEDGYVRNLFDLSTITERFEYEFSGDEKYFYLSSVALTADPVFKLKKKRMELPLVTDADNGNILQVVDGQWKAVDALKDPLVLHVEKAAEYTEDATIGDEALNAILTGRQIVIRVPNADGGKYTAIYSPVYMYQLPNYQNKYLYLFYLNDGLDASGMPSYSQLKMLLSKEYNYSPLE